MGLIRDLTARPGTPDRAGLVALVHASPTLQRAIHAKGAGLVRQLAAEIAAATGVPAHDPVATAAAFSMLGAYRALTHEYDRRRAAGQDAAGGFLALQADAERVFDLLEHGLGDYGSATPAAAKAEQEPQQ